MWKWRSNDKVTTVNPKYSEPKRCPICGQYFKKDERACIIIIPNEYKNTHPKLKENLMVHEAEWDTLIHGLTTDQEVAEAVMKHKTPRTAPLTDDEKARLDAFVKACESIGFREVFTKPFGVKCKQRGISVVFTYNVFMDSIDIDHRGNRGLFDAFYEKQLIAKVFNKMHEILGDGQVDNYSAQKSLDEIADRVKKTMEELT